MEERGPMSLMWQGICIEFDKLDSKLNMLIELVAREREMIEVDKLEDAITAMQMVPKDGVKGIFPCPICKTGEIHWWRAGTKKHLRMHCTTANCLVLIQ